MKGGIAASIIAVECFVAVSPNYSGRIELSFTADEETGGYGGVAFLANEGYFSPDRISSVIIPEPLNKIEYVWGIEEYGGQKLKHLGKLHMDQCHFLEIVQFAIWELYLKNLKKNYTQNSRQ